MKSIQLLICLLLLNCGTNKKIKIEPIITEPIRVKVQNPETGALSYKNSYKMVTDPLAPQIIVIENKGGSVHYRIQGNIRSGGLSIHRVKRVSLERVIVGDVLVLRHTAMVIRLAGKEGSLIKGYNYSKEEYQPIPKGIKSIKIELYEDRTSASRSQPFTPVIHLLTEESFDL